MRSFQGRSDMENHKRAHIDAKHLSVQTVTSHQPPGMRLRVTWRCILTCVLTSVPAAALPPRIKKTCEDTY
ncbi:hypothetical protein WMY93_030361 [Mugilogobius chulae]|uniref:Uncharacterized protein n=1 Tax=Mugilogobius chulae TaxID=88201 RepID=A0AAW0MFB3_9GOBI